MIDTAILLAAGEGSRLRSSAAVKPLCNVAGKSLLAHAIGGLAKAGLKRVVVVLGYAADQIDAVIASTAWPIEVQTVRTPDYRQPNGTSLLAAEPVVESEEAVLAMCDHLVDPGLYYRLATAGASFGAQLGVDRDLQSDWIDLDDVTRVQTSDERIVAIGKELAPFDSFDTGVFAIGPALFAALNGLASPSLTEGMRALAAVGKASAVDCTGLRWIDVDDEAALNKAEAWLEAEGQRHRA